MNAARGAGRSRPDESHGHDHGHHHHHHVPSSTRMLVIALVLTIAFAGVEAAAGWLAGSLALLGDAGHMLTDSLSLAIGALSAWLSERRATPRLSFGWQRAELVGALVNVVFMYLVVAAIVISAVRRLVEPLAVEGGAVVTVGTLGLLVNLLVAWLLTRGERNLNTRGAMLHVLGDLLGSIAAVASGVVVMSTGWMRVDPLLSLLICGLILLSSTRLLVDLLRMMMAGVPAGIDLDEIATAIRELDGSITGVHHLHVWELSSKSVALSAHVELRHLEQWSPLLGRIAAMLQERFGIDHPTLQPELGTCADQLRDGAGGVRA